jgi:hypothetical protein
LRDLFMVLIAYNAVLAFDKTIGHSNEHIIV